MQLLQSLLLHGKRHQCSCVLFYCQNASGAILCGHRVKVFTHTIPPRLSLHFPCNNSKHAGHIPPWCPGAPQFIGITPLLQQVEQDLFWNRVPDIPVICPHLMPLYNIKRSGHRIKSAIQAMAELMPDACLLFCIGAGFGVVSPI